MDSKSSSPKPPTPIYYWAKLIGLAPFTLKKNGFCPANFPDTLYPVTLAATYLLGQLIPFCTSVELAPDGSSHLAKSTSTLYLLLNGAVTFFTLITFLLMSKDIIYTMNKLCSIHNELKSIGVDEDLEKLFKNIFVVTTTANTVVGAVCLITDLFEPDWSVYLSIAHIIQECIRLNTFLIFVQILLCIGRRFTLLNKKLYDVFKFNHCAGSASNIHALVAEKTPKKDDREDHFRKLGVLHLELAELVDRTTQIFGIPILLNTLSFLCEFVVSSRRIYFVDLNPSDHDAAKNVWLLTANILCPILRMAIVTVESVIIAYVTTTTCQQGDAIKIVLFRAWNKFAPKELMDEFFMFSLQLLHKPVVVAALGFFHLDYSYVCKIFCVMTAYFVIMVQLDASKQNFGT